MPTRYEYCDVCEENRDGNSKSNGEFLCLTCNPRRKRRTKGEVRNKSINRKVKEGKGGGDPNANRPSYLSPKPSFQPSKKKQKYNNNNNNNGSSSSSKNKNKSFKQNKIFSKLNAGNVPKYHGTFKTIPSITTSRQRAYEFYRLYKTGADALAKHFLKDDRDLTDAEMRKFHKLVAHFDKTVPSGPLFEHIKKTLSPHTPKVSPIERRRLLSNYVLDKTITRLDLASYLETTITNNQWKFAKIHALKFGPGQQPPTIETTHRQRVSSEKLNKLFKCLMGSIARNSFGWKLYEMANGDIARIPSLLRERQVDQIFKEYLEECLAEYQCSHPNNRCCKREEKHLKSTQCYKVKGHEGSCKFTPPNCISMKSTRKIIEIFAPTEVTSLAGLDNIAIINGYESFKTLLKAIKKLHECTSMPESTFTEMTDIIKNYEIFLKTDFIDELTLDNCCSPFCMRRCFSVKKPDEVEEEAMEVDDDNNIQDDNLEDAVVPAVVDIPPDEPTADSLAENFEGWVVEDVAATPIEYYKFGRSSLEQYSHHSTTETAHLAINMYEIKKGVSTVVEFTPFADLQKEIFQNKTLHFVGYGKDGISIAKMKYVCQEENVAFHMDKIQYMDKHMLKKRLGQVNASQGGTNHAQKKRLFNILKHNDNWDKSNDYIYEEEEEIEEEESDEESDEDSDEESEEYSDEYSDEDSDEESEEDSDEDINNEEQEAANKQAINSMSAPADDEKLECDHEHDRYSQDIVNFSCVGLQLLSYANEYIDAVQASDPNNIEDKATAMQIKINIEQCIKNEKIYRAHLGRGKREDELRRARRDNLVECEGILVCDWKQRLLCHMFRESSSEYYGKTGTPCLGFMVIQKAPANCSVELGGSGDMLVSFFDLITNDQKEDWYSVSVGTMIVLKMLRDHPIPELRINKIVALEEDGAGCFTCQSGRNIFRFYKKWTQVLGDGRSIEVVALSFGEAQMNKTDLDAHFAYIGGAVAKGVKTGNIDAIDADQSVLAINVDGVRSTVCFSFEPDRTRQPKPPKGMKANTDAWVETFEFTADNGYVVKGTRSRNYGLGPYEVCLDIDLNAAWKDGLPQEPKPQVEVNHLDQLAQVRTLPQRKDATTSETEKRAIRSNTRVENSGLAKKRKAADNLQTWEEAGLFLCKKVDDNNNRCRCIFTSRAGLRNHTLRVESFSRRLTSGAIQPDDAKDADTCNFPSLGLFDQVLKFASDPAKLAEIGSKAIVHTRPTGSSNSKLLAGIVPLFGLELDANFPHPTIGCYRKIVGREVLRYTPEQREYLVACRNRGLVKDERKTFKGIADEMKTIRHCNNGDGSNGNLVFTCLKENSNGNALSEERIKAWFGQNKSAEKVDPRKIYWKTFDVSFLRSFLNYTEDRKDDGYIQTYKADLALEAYEHEKAEYEGKKLGFYLADGKYYCRRELN